MSYSGVSVPVPLGQLGLKTDDPMTTLPPNAAIKANNVRLMNSRLEKTKGSAKYNATALESGIVAAYDYWPSPSTQRLIVLTRNGKAWRDTGDGTFGSATAIATGLGVLTTNSHFCPAGNEAAGEDKKLLIFTGTSQVQVLTADGSTLAPISAPAADWASNFPTFGIPFAGRIAALGNPNAPHTLYFSRIDDHEDFDGSATDNPIFTVFPGEGDGLVSAAVYKGRLFLFKKPGGVYYIDDLGSSDPADWSVKKLTDGFGIASPHAIAEVLEDLWVMSTANSLTSMSAALQLGDVKSGDILAQAQVEDYFKQEFDPAGIPFAQSLWYSEKKIAMFTGRALSGDNQNKILVIDIARQSPRITIETKDQPNCLALRKDSSGIPRPIYGSESGFIYRMEQADYNVGGAAYLGEFQTPYMDFAWADQALASKNKIFDFLEVQYIAVGNYSFYVDVYVDNKFVETLSFLQSQGASLDTFELDEDAFGSLAAQDRRKPLHSTGRRISFRFYNNGTDEYFKIEKFIVSFRLSGEQQKPLSGNFSI